MILKVTKKQSFTHSLQKVYLQKYILMVKVWIFKMKLQY